jgi:hypothetical protein
VAKLLNRFGRQIATLRDLSIAYPVGRSGVPFEASVAAGALYNLDITQLRFFLVQDDEGNRYPALIEHVGLAASDLDLVAIRGIVVASGR